MLRTKSRRCGWNDSKKKVTLPRTHDLSDLRGIFACHRFTDTTMMSRSVLQILLASSFLYQAVGQGYTTLTAEEFYNMKDDFDAIVDVRSVASFLDGHIEGAFLVPLLATPLGSPDALAGCEYCSIVVYCSTPIAARVALDKLIAAGFKGPLYDGQDISQWTAAGYPLVKNSVSQVPECTTNRAKSDECYATWLEEQNCVPDNMPCDYYSDTCCGSGMQCAGICLLGKKGAPTGNAKDEEKTKLQYSSLRRGHRTGTGGRGLLKGA